MFSDLRRVQYFLDVYILEWLQDQYRAPVAINIVCILNSFEEYKIEMQNSYSWYKVINICEYFYIFATGQRAIS